MDRETATKELGALLIAARPDLFGMNPPSTGLRFSYIHTKGEVDVIPLNVDVTRSYRASDGQAYVSIGYYHKKVFKRTIKGGWPVDRVIAEVEARLAKVVTIQARTAERTTQQAELKVWAAEQGINLDAAAPVVRLTLAYDTAVDVTFKRILSREEAARLIRTLRVEGWLE